MTTLFGTKYFFYIAASYGITAAVLFSSIVLVILTHQRHRLKLRKLEESGLRRGGAKS